MTTRPRPAILEFLLSQGTLVPLLVLCGVSALCFPSFIGPTNLANIFRQASIPGIVAVGMTFVILSGGIDLSVGATVAVTSIITAQLGGESSVLALSAAVLAGALIGAVNGALIAYAKIEAFIVTLATMLGLRGLAFIMASGEPVATDKSTWLAQLAKVDIGVVPLIGIIFILILLVATVIAEHSRFGRSLYAIGGNEEAAVMMGLNVKRNKMLAYVICGFLSGVAGVMITSRLGSGQPSAAEGYELLVIAAVVIGGTSLDGGIGKMSHTLYGVLILGVIPNVNNLHGVLKYWYVDLIRGLLLLAVVLLQSTFTRKQEDA